MNQENEKKNISYSDTGVDISMGKKFVESIKNHAKKTFNNNVLTNIGQFGGLFDISSLPFKEPVLVSSTDGVGTKIKVAVAANLHKNIGIDIVSHCVNDIMVQGAHPLFFLDYIGCGKLSHQIMLQLVEGMKDACIESGCALIGGETAEMPDVYKEGEYDLVGTIVGIVDKKNIIDGSKITCDNVLIGLPSNGLHTNGYTLARKIIFDIKKFAPNTKIDELENTIAIELLKPHRSYCKVLKELFDKTQINGIAHITGGGVIENIPRILPLNCSAEINKDTMPVPQIFDLMKTWGPVDESEMYRVFNMGIGLVIVAEKNDSEAILKIAKEFYPEASVIGKIITGNQKTVLN
ncbi:MAG: phosphoribosylformylglycinamidine cyclo-ligase [Candidatus Aureabacteria bacterium]|nr:phosphoribosylformylglycinamidine cyclo-ligase [Candidatus Auribacterota bacterium]